MEKVVILHGHDYIYDEDDINEYLEKGWTVKSVSTVATKEYVTAIFVLEK